MVKFPVEINELVLVVDQPDAVFDRIKDGPEVGFAFKDFALISLAHGNITAEYRKNLTAIGMGYRLIMDSQ